MNLYLGNHKTVEKEKNSENRNYWCNGAGGRCIKAGTDTGDLS